MNKLIYWSDQILITYLTKVFLELSCHEQIMTTWLIVSMYVTLSCFNKAFGE